MRHIEVRALVSGYLDQILVQEGQAVKHRDSMFKILKTLYQADLDAKLAEVQSAQVELEQSKRLFNDKVVSHVDVALHEAKLANAQAEAKRAEAELNFTDIKAPFDGIVVDVRLRSEEAATKVLPEGSFFTVFPDPKGECGVTVASFEQEDATAGTSVESDEVGP